MSEDCGPDSCEAYTVAWIAALPSELAAGQAMFDEEYQQPPSDFNKSRGDPNSYSWGKIGKHYTVVAALPAGEYGLTAAAVVAQGLCQSLPHIRIGLLVGIGAGVREVLDRDGQTMKQRDIRLGDVVVSQPAGTIGGVVQADFVKAKLVDSQQVLERKGFLGSPPLPLRTAVTKLQALHKRKGSRMLEVIGKALEKNPGMQAEFCHPGVERPESERKTDSYHARDGSEIFNEARKIPKVHYGIIASSNSLEKSAQHRDAYLARLANESIDPMCFEMEAAGLMNNFPCLVIRGICDYGDEHKNDDWQDYAALTAAGFGKELLECVDITEIQQTQTIGKLMLEKLTTLQGDIQNLQSDVASHIRDSLLQWLCSRDYSEQFEDNRKIHQPGTGQWFLNHQTFQEWAEANGSCTLFCPGDPGTGKTILSTLVIDHLYRKDSTKPVIYLFCNYKRQDEQTLSHFAASLLRQLASVSKEVFRIVKQVRDGYEAKKLRPSLQDLESHLGAAFKSVEGAFVIIDALDESRSDIRRKLIQLIRNQMAQCKIHFLTTARDEPDIRTIFSEDPSLRITAAEEDIRSYSEIRVAEFSQDLQRNESLKEHMINCVVDASEGMFLLAQLHMDSLDYQLTANDVRKTLRGLRSGVEAYNIAYKAAMERVEGHHHVRHSLAKHIFAWVVHAKRPLRFAEVEHALATRPGSKRLDDGDFVSMETALSYCAGLITFDSKSHTIRLVHYTAQEYFRETWIRWFRDESMAIADTCITYLSFDEFKAGPCETREELTRRVGKYELLDYAAQHWGNHAQDLESVEHGIDLAAGSAAWSFIRDENLVGFAAQVAWDPWQPEYDSDGFRYPLKTSGLHLAATFGILRLMELLIEDGHQLDIKDDDKFPPLSRAASRGHIAAVRMLLDRGANYDYALYIASACGHTEIARLLLDRGADIHAEVGSVYHNQLYGDRNALCAASANGYTETAKLLLDRGADINARGPIHNALYCASEGGHTEIVRLLLDRGADVNTQGRYDNALDKASEGGHTEIVKLLLDRGADVNALGYFGNALSSASYSGHAEIVKLLLDRGADINANGGDALCAASYNGYTEIVKLLLDLGSDINARGPYGNALYSASEQGHAEIVKRLLDRGADVNAQGGFYGRALDTASYFGRTEIVKLLLDRGADVNTQGRYDNALDKASEGGHTEIVKLLLDRGADVNAQGGFYGNALSSASDGGHAEIVKLLLDRGAVIDSQGLFRDVLDRALAKGHEDIAELLIDRGARSKRRRLQ